MVDKMENQSMFDKVIHNTYFAYILLSILKMIFIYIIYIFARYLWKRHFFCNRNDRILALEDTKSCCARITSYITLKVNSSDDREIELEEIPSTSDNSNVPLRRSGRIAQLKIN